MQGREGTFVRELTENWKVRDNLVDKNIDGKMHNMAHEAHIINSNLLLRVFIILRVYKYYCLDCNFISADSL